MEKINRMADNLGGGGPRAFGDSAIPAGEPGGAREAEADSDPADAGEARPESQSEASQWMSV
jgi:hypothetical protein